MSTPLPEQQLPPVKIAFVIDGEVVDVLHTDNRLAAIFLSSPTVIDVTKDFDSGMILPGSKYNKKTKKFNAPEGSVQPSIPVVTTDELPVSEEPVVDSEPENNA